MRTSGIALAVGLVLGFIASAWSARNSSGTYSLPSGNPVVSGTTISSTWANNTLNDVKSEITDSLSRSNKGAMLAPLELVASGGSVGTPALSFDGDENTGLYRIGADNLGITTGGVKRIDVGGSTAVTGALSCSAGFTATQSTTNGSGGTFTGDGTGRGVVATGGATSGLGGLFTGGAPNGIGIQGAGTGTGYGVNGVGGSSGGQGIRGTGGTNGLGGEFFGVGTGDGINSTGGATGRGVVGVGGATSGVGGKFTGGGTSTGLEAWNGTDATGGTRQDALKVANGDVDMSNVADPTSTTSVTDRITPVSFVKAWANLTLGAASPTVNAAFNVASTSCAANEVTVTIAGDMASANYAVSAVFGSASHIPRVTSTAAGSFVIGANDAAGTVINLCSGGTPVLHVMAIGAQ